MSDTPITDTLARFRYPLVHQRFVEEAECAKLERELNEAKANADALADAIEYTLKADAILHPETDHVGMRQALETYRSKYPQ
jgi:hypothetical protein